MKSRKQVGITEDSFSVEVTLKSRMTRRKSPKSRVRASKKSTKEQVQMVQDENGICRLKISKIKRDKGLRES